MVYNQVTKIQHTYTNETYVKGAISPSLKCRDPAEHLVEPKSQHPLSEKIVRKKIKYAHLYLKECVQDTRILILK